MKKIFILLFSISFINLAQAQKITGLWLVKQVKVGDQIMTPQSKWFRIHKDGTYQSGNGWLQNGVGTWTYDKKRKLYAPQERLGLKDPFGAFTTHFDAGGMQWEREEEGIKVRVLLERVEQLPKGTADKLVGMWALTKVQKVGKDYDPDQKQNLFIRWDRIYLQWDEQGKKSTGYWHIHAHKPEITLLSHVTDKKPESWKVEVTDTTLKFIGISTTNADMALMFTRKDQFPN
ncbi:MAG: hypothetical protein ACPGJS_14610 [Flammeovirgaceae bacterium]